MNMAENGRNMQVVDHMFVYHCTYLKCSCWNI